MNKDKILAKQNLEMAFKTFDKDSSGKISLDEIMQIFNMNTAGVPIEKSVFENILKEADQNGDGEISFEEFKTLMTSFFE
jgi:calcium-dependent protein kinase